MGYTDFTKKQVERAISYTAKPRQSVIELGSQQDHTSSLRPMPYMNDWFLNRMGFDEYRCIDINGENNALNIDLSKPLDYGEHSSCDLVTQIGTFEHVSGPDGKFSWEASYWCWHHIYYLANLATGVIYNESPQTGSWPKHGVAYLTAEFIYQLCEASGLRLIDIGVHPACHNTRNGYNVWAIMQHTGKGSFPDLATFKTFDLRQS